jgi:hypothetical protein
MLEMLAARFVNLKQNRTTTYSKKLSMLFSIKVALLQSSNYLGKPADSLKY